MGAVGLIALWAALFLAGHFILSSDAVRGAIAGAVGSSLFAASIRWSRSERLSR